ncbi:MAG TPA: secondary thiamine-phosphate synthase enzyme YjbQ [Bryobacterales bacterium]|nr:secondary thiamine-phosphate synthase enzyme YjbQ [Bryobacterales bacterium]
MLEKFKLETKARNVMVDVTAEVQKAVDRSGVRDGIACIFTPHTTAAIAINEHDDPDVARDILATLCRLVPKEGDYRHYEENSDATLNPRWPAAPKRSLSRTAACCWEPGREFFSVNSTAHATGKCG